MPAYPLSNFHEAMRALLMDEGDAVAGYDYMDAQLDGGLRTAVRMGLAPGVALDDDPNKLASAPANPDTWGNLVAQTVRLMIGGGLQESIRTRAMSSLVDPASRRDAVTFLDTMISELDARGNVGGTAADTTHKGLFASQDDVMTRIALCPRPAHTQPPWCS